MIELLVVFIPIVVLVIVAIRIGKQDNTPSEPTDRRASGLSEGLSFVRQHAEQTGDTEAVQAIDNGTYNELLERRAAKRQASISSDIISYPYNIAGINFRRGISNYVGISTGCLQPEPTNKYDPNAIAVYHNDGHHLGYIPAEETEDVRNLHLRFPIPVSIKIEECFDDYENRTFYVGEVTIYVKRKNARTMSADA